MSDEKRMIENYEIKTAIHIGGHEIIFAEDIKAAMPFLVCDHYWDNPLNADEYKNAFVSDNYVEMMTMFSNRLSEQVQRLDAERARRGIPTTPLTYADCIPGSERADYAGQVIVLKPESIASFARTPDHQLFLAVDGNGARADARGNAVFCYNLYTGEHGRRERYNVAGIINPAKMPTWAAEKLAALEEKLQAEKPSIMEKLEKGKQAAAEQTDTPKDPKKPGPEL